MYRLFTSLFLTASLLLAPLTIARAQAPPAATQVPGYYRLMVGQFEVTALFDGALQLDKMLLHPSQPVDMDQMLARMFVGNPKMQTAVNGFLINTGDHLVLIDAGAAKLFGPNLGHIADNLRAAGYTPEQVDTVILTHLHGDHIGGLLNGEGKPLFAKAAIRVAQAEQDYWLSPEIAAAAPEKAKAGFQRVRDIAAPYIASGQWRPFAEGAVLVPGITAVKADGHTPGHSAYAVSSAGQNLLIWGDLIHAHAIQFEKPEVAIEFDVDQARAIATRKALLEKTAKEHTLVAGMHLPFPGIGHVRAEGQGSYAWVPIEFAPLP